MHLPWFLAIIVGVVLQLGACSSPQNEVLGKWESADKEESVEFFEDKTLTMTDSRNDTATGKWALLSDGRIKIDLTFLGMPIPPAMGSLKGETLALEGGLWDKNRAGMVFRKAKK